MGALGPLGTQRLKVCKHTPRTSYRSAVVCGASSVSANETNSRIRPRSTALTRSKPCWRAVACSCPVPVIGVPLVFACTLCWSLKELSTPPCGGLSLFLCMKIDIFSHLVVPPSFRSSQMGTRANLAPAVEDATYAIVILYQYDIM